MQEQIRVGVVGANARRSRASVSQVPAIKGLTGLTLAAVATRNKVRGKRLKLSALIAGFPIPWR